MSEIKKAFSPLRFSYYKDNTGSFLRNQKIQKKEKEENKKHCPSWLFRDSPKYTLQYLYFYIDRYFKNGIIYYKLPCNMLPPLNNIHKFPCCPHCLC